MAAKITIQSKDMVAACHQIYAEYGYTVTAALERATEKTARKALKLIKTFGYYLNITGKYRDGFYIKKKRIAGVGMVYYLANKRYHLSHLLENGHENRDGTRSRAYPHFGPAADYIYNALPNLFKEELAKGEKK